MVRMDKLLAALIVGSACCLLVVATRTVVEASEPIDYLSELGAISSMDGQCKTGGARSCCKRASWALSALRMMVEDIIQCKASVFYNMVEGKMKFPRVCCKLPIFRRTCREMGIIEGGNGGGGGGGGGSGSGSGSGGGDDGVGDKYIDDELERVAFVGSGKTGRSRRIML